MLKVKHERPSQRLKHRVVVPIKVELIGEGLFDSRDWSLNGIALKGYTGQHQVGDKVDLEISIPFQGFDISFLCESEVVRREDDIIALKYLSLNERGQDLMTHFIEEVIRGSVTSTDEVLRRIDTPVTPVTTTEEASDADEMPIKRISWKVVRMVITHILVGAIVFGYGGYFIYKNFFMLKVTTAVISAPVNPLLSPVNGYLTEIVAPQGENVGERSVLMRLSNPELDNKVDFARINVDRKMMELRVRRKEYEAEKQKKEDFKRIAETKLNMIEREMDHLRAREILESLRHDVIEEEFLQGASNEMNVIDSSLRKIDSESKLDEARELLRSRRLLMDSIERGTLVHDNLASKIHQSQMKMEFAEDQLILARDELSALKKQQSWMNITAPARGQVVQWLRAPGTAIKKGEKLALFELDEARVIKAYLTPFEILKVGMNDEATVYFPSIDRYIEARITDIDATSGTLSAQDIDYIWRRPNEPSAQVTMEFVGISAEEIRKSFPSGLPATVEFSQRGTNESDPQAVVDTFGDWFSKGLTYMQEMISGKSPPVLPLPEQEFPKQPAPPEPLPSEPAPNYPALMDTNPRPTYTL